MAAITASSWSQRVSVVVVAITRALKSVDSFFDEIMFDSSVVDAFNGTTTIDIG